MSSRPNSSPLLPSGAFRPRTLTILRLTLAAIVGVLSVRGDTPVAAERWIGAWATAPLAGPARDETVSLAGKTLRQVVRVTLRGDRFRVRISNAFGTEPLRVRGARVAPARAAGAIDPDRDRPLFVQGERDFSIPPGALTITDPVEFSVAPLDDLAISLHLGETPDVLTVHPGARIHSYLQSGDALSSATLPDASRVVRWYFLTGVEVAPAGNPAGAIAILGDSITDGYGCTPDRYERWTDELARRFAEAGDPANAILNLGLGGNRLLRDGLGPNALARFERDVLGHPGIRELVIFIGVNDLGTRVEARDKNRDFATADEIIAGLAQLVRRARAHGIRVIGATITPFSGNANYTSADGESDRQLVNTWIRAPGNFDGVIDFDALLRDPAEPTRLAPDYDSGDHLHPSIAGYTHMARALDLRVFQPRLP